MSSTITDHLVSWRARVWKVPRGNPPAWKFNTLGIKLGTFDLVSWAPGASTSGTKLEASALVSWVSKVVWLLQGKQHQAKKDTTKRVAVGTACDSSEGGPTSGITPQEQLKFHEPFAKPPRIHEGKLAGRVQEGCRKGADFKLASRAWHRCGNEDFPDLTVVTVPPVVADKSRILISQAE